MADEKGYQSDTHVHIGHKEKCPRDNKSIVLPQKVASVDLTPIEKQLEECSLSPNKDGYDVNPAVGVYHSPFSCLTAISTDEADCLPSCNPVEQGNSPIPRSVYVEQITCDQYRCYHNNKWFAPMDVRIGTIAKDCRSW